MGQVIAFERAAAALPGPSAQISRLEGTLLALSQDMRSVDTTAESIWRDLKVIMGVLESTEDFELRARLLRDITTIRFQLQLASLILRRTRETIGSG